MIAVLFARADSVYKSIPDCDVYDAARDARTWLGGQPVVAHPPCRLWSRMRKFSKAPPEERGLALWAVEQVKRFGGVLEHPSTSGLWREDVFSGGVTITLDQFWFGHPAEKRTTLFIVGARLDELPAIPYRMDEPTHVVAKSRLNLKKKKKCSKRWREATPPAFAAWLCEVARRCRAPGQVTA